MYSFVNDVFTDHVSCSHRTTNHTFKDFIEHNFKTVKTEEEKKILGDSDSERPMSALESKDSENGEALDQETKVEKPDPKKKSIIIRPFGDANKLLIYIEDIHMSRFDQFQDNSTVEALRDLLSGKIWYSSRKKSLRRVEDVNLVACMGSSCEMSQKISSRFLRHFLPLG